MELFENLPEAKPPARSRGAGLAGAAGPTPRRENDAYFTPWGATVALMIVLQDELRQGPERRGGVIWEPFAGDGGMAFDIKQWVAPSVRVVASDINPKGFGVEQRDAFSDDGAPPGFGVAGSSWIISNPPFKSAVKIIARYAGTPHVNMALLLPMRYFNTGRGLRLASPCSTMPLSWRPQFSPEAPGMKKRSPMMDVGWYLWPEKGRCIIAPPHYVMPRPTQRQPGLLP